MNVELKANFTLEKKNIEDHREDERYSDVYQWQVTDITRNDVVQCDVVAVH